jgi:hypothetical protein
MDNPPENPQLQPAPERPVRLPSKRAGGMLAAVMLGAGILLGAAIGPAPDASFAGGPSAFMTRVPLLIAAIEARNAQAAAATAATPASEPPAVEPQATPTPAPASKAPAKAAESPPAEESKESSPSEGSKKPKKATLPAITNVWLIQLAGNGFEAAESQASAAPYIDTQLIPSSTFLSGWSAIQASAFASEAALAEPPAVGAPPPLVHSIVQPPCPEGPAGATCASETPGQLTAADEFLKATLASITGTALYKEHGLIVVTFSSVGLASQSELPAGASTSTLTYQPPAGVALLSPFAKAGVRSKVSFNPTSPRQSLEKLLH